MLHQFCKQVYIQSSRLLMGLQKLETCDKNYGDWARTRRRSAKTTRNLALSARSTFVFNSSRNLNDLRDVSCFSQNLVGKSSTGTRRRSSWEEGDDNDGGRTDDDSDDGCPRLRRAYTSAQRRLSAPSNFQAPASDSSSLSVVALDLRTWYVQMNF